MALSQKEIIEVKGMTRLEIITVPWEELEKKFRTCPEKSLMITYHPKRGIGLSICEID